MRGILCIFQKELKGFFANPNYYVVAALLSLTLSSLFPGYLAKFAQMSNAAFQQMGMRGESDIHFGVFMQVASLLNLLLIFMTPALTMRLLSEEKKMKTMDLLMTVPVTSLDIVLGKYLAAACAVGGLAILASLYPLSTMGFASNVNWLAMAICFLSMFLVGCVYTAVDLFCSSLTESQIVSYVFSVVLNISLWFLASGAELTDNATVRQVFEHISLPSHISALASGTIRTSSLVFLFSVISLFVFLSERVVESARWR